MDHRSRTFTTTGLHLGFERDYKFQVPFGRVTSSCMRSIAVMDDF